MNPVIVKTAKMNLGSLQGIQHSIATIANTKQSMPTASLRRSITIKAKWQDPAIADPKHFHRQPSQSSSQPASDA